MRICCISDTHEKHHHLTIPVCDVLIHAGDITMRGLRSSLEDFHLWCSHLLETERVRKILVIAGNHDFLFEQEPARAREIFRHVRYLQDEEFGWEGVHFYGTPWQPWFYDWAFNLRTEAELEEKFRHIPEGTDVLISHGPPRGILDHTHAGESVGSTALLERIRKIRPKLVVFGHIHAGYGVQHRDGILYVNASMCDERYRAVHTPIVVELNSGQAQCVSGEFDTRR